MNRMTFVGGPRDGLTTVPISPITSNVFACAQPPDHTVHWYVVDHGGVTCTHAGTYADFVAENGTPDYFVH